MFDKKYKGRWWDFGWKLVEGCTPVSMACKHCWSMAMEKRFRKETGIVFHHERLERPLKLKKPASYAIWNDLFHESVHFQDIIEVFHVINKCPQHIFQILTKRPERMREFFIDTAYNPYWENLQNIMLGVTAENQEMADKRIPVLLQIPAKVHFVSFEPLLSNINLLQACQIKFINWMKNNVTQYGLEWIICGPETGTGKRIMLKKWIESLYAQCREANVPFFDKKDILGKNIRQFPI